MKLFSPANTLKTFNLHIHAFMIQEQPLRGLDGIYRATCHISKKSTAFDFLTTFELDVLKWLLDSAAKGNNHPAIFKIFVAGTILNRKINFEFTSIEACREWWQQSLIVPREVLLNIAKKVIETRQIDSSKEEAILSTLHGNDWESFSKWLRETSLTGEDQSFVLDLIMEKVRVKRALRLVK